MTINLWNVDYDSGRHGGDSKMEKKIQKEHEKREREREKRRREEEEKRKKKP